MEKGFPLDCFGECPHFHCWDMSVDDWTNACDLLKLRMDDCDAVCNCSPCPLSEEERNKIKGEK